MVHDHPRRPAFGAELIKKFVIGEPSLKAKTRGDGSLAVTTVLQGRREMSVLPSGAVREKNAP